MKRKIKEYFISSTGDLVEAPNEIENSQAPKEAGQNVDTTYNQNPSYQESINNNQNMNSQSFENQNFNNQGYVNQGFENQNFNNQNVNNQGFGNQNFNNQGYVNQNFNNQGYVNLNMNNQEVRVNYDYSRPSVIAEKEYNEDPKLLMNPFFYDYDPLIVDNIHQINSIEDFYILRKKKYYNFGALVRNDDMWLSKRKKILKKQMHTWNQEFSKRLSDVGVLGSSQFQSAEKRVGRGVNFIFPILAFITLFTSTLLLNGKVWVLHSPGNPWILLGVYIAFIASFFTFFMTFLINKSINSVKKLNRINRNEYAKMKVEIDKEFIKKFHYTYNYYVTGLRKKYKKPVLLLDKTSVGESKIKNIEAVITENSKKVLDANKVEKSLSFPKFLLNLVSALSCAFVLLYAIYEIAIYFIKR